MELYCHTCKQWTDEMSSEEINSHAEANLIGGIHTHKTEWFDDKNDK